MSNRTELQKARSRAAYATYAADRIAALPPRNGSHIVWPNGTIWTRTGDDRWEAEDLPGHPYSSEHVATISDWAPLSKRQYERHISQRGNNRPEAE